MNFIKLKNTYENKNGNDIYIEITSIKSLAHSYNFEGATDVNISNESYTVRESIEYIIKTITAVVL